MRVGSLSAMYPDTLEQLASRNTQRPCQLVHGAHSGLALSALDLGHVRGIEAGVVREAFLAQIALLPEPSQVGGEGVECVGHVPTMLRHLSQ